MKNINKRKITSMILGMGISIMSVNSYAASQTVGAKSTATLAASCTISAQTISFGTIALPLYAQSANSNMNVLCSKEAAYKIDLTFGLSSTYWALGSSGGLYSSPTWSANASKIDSTGKILSTQSFGYPRNGDPAAYMEAALGCKITADGKCHVVSTSSTAGTMLGLKGDSVSYTIFIPGDSSKVWNVNKNSYTATGIGTNQTIPVLAQLVPASSSAYPTPDMYTDTVIATITY